jgi:serine/threonine-protein kinase
MLKDNFSRKPKKLIPPRQYDVPPGSPELNPAHGLPPVSPDAAAAPAPQPQPQPQAPPARPGGPPKVTDSQTLAAMVLGRLADTYSEPDAVVKQRQEAARSGSFPSVAQQSVPSEPEPSMAGRFQQIQPCELSGTVINELYMIKGQLGRGGMGQVLLCHNLRRNVDVVMKLMLVEANPDDKNFHRFTQECKAAHRIQHKNVVTVMDYGILLDTLQPYLVMEFVDGLSLRQLLRQRKTLTPPEIGEILMQACNGLHEVHGRGVIHRDLKPDNIMIETDGQIIENVKILDFGIAQLQRKNSVNDQGVAVGSVLYMSPEQACGKPVDHRTDIWAIGAMLYEAVAGQPPFKGASMSQTMSKVVTAPLVPPSHIIGLTNIAAVDAICEKALAKSPADRYQNAAELQMDLAGLLS